MHADDAILSNGKLLTADHNIRKELLKYYQEYIRRKESVLLHNAVCEHSVKSTEVNLYNTPLRVHLSTHQCLAW